MSVKNSRPRSVCVKLVNAPVLVAIPGTFFPSKSPMSRLMAVSRSISERSSTVTERVVSEIGCSMRDSVTTVSGNI